MRVIIVGCGRVGAGLAEVLARSDNEVTIIDIASEAFARLEADFPGTAVRGDGTDEDVLRRAGAEGADWFFGLTEGDNRNVLTAQLASESLGIPHVVAKVNDPVRAQAYTDLGLATICRTTMLVDALAQFAGLPADRGVVGVSEATGYHPGGDHHARPAAGDANGTRRQGAATAVAGTDELVRTSPDDSSGRASVAADGARPETPSPAPAAPDAGGGGGRRPWKLLRRNGGNGPEA